MNQQRGNDQFHDSESEDVYDLYNACNGVIHDGVLDIRKLEELSEEECEVLDVPRLKELGAHVVSGCARCEVIINTLNQARRALRMSAEDSRGEQPQTVGANHVD
jgi:hypothetical protein